MCDSVNVEDRTMFNWLNNVVVIELTLQYEVSQVTPDQN